VSPLYCCCLNDHQGGLLRTCTRPMENLLPSSSAWQLLLDCGPQAPRLTRTRSVTLDQSRVSSRYCCCPSAMDLTDKRDLDLRYGLNPEGKRLGRLLPYKQSEARAYDLLEAGAGSPHLDTPPSPLPPPPPPPPHPPSPFRTSALGRLAAVCAGFSACHLLP